MFLPLSKLIPYHSPPSYPLVILAFFKQIIISWAHWGYFCFRDFAFILLSSGNFLLPCLCIVNIYSSFSCHFSHYPVWVTFLTALPKKEPLVLVTYFPLACFNFFIESVTPWNFLTYIFICIFACVPYLHLTQAPVNLKSHEGQGPSLPCAYNSIWHAVSIH